MVRCATAPGSWGVERPDALDNPPWERVLSEIAAAGYEGTELGPLGYLPLSPSALRAHLDQRGLGLPAGFLMEVLDDPRQRDAVERKARETCAFLSALGASHLILICALTEERMSTAGRSEDATRLDLEAWRVLLDSVERIARIARENFRLRTAFHPHVGTAVEFEDEVERLLADTDADLVGLCVDTGHSFYAGIDPVQLCRRHEARLEYLHLKDVDPLVLDSVIARALPFFAAVGEGVFCPLGRGAVDFAALARALDAIGYQGWATVEQDRLPTGTGSPLEDARASLEHLHQVGLAAAAQRRTA